MSIIQFENGTKVDFKGDPTPADIEEVASKVGVSPSQKTPVDNRDFLDKATDALNSVFPNKNLGRIVGNALYAGGQDIKALFTGGPKAFYNKVQEQGADVTPTNQDVKGVVGDVAGDVINGLLAASGGSMTEGASLATRSLVAGSAGTGLSLANSASEGRDLTNPQTIKDALASGTLNALFPILGKGLASLNMARKAGSGITPQLVRIIENSTPEEVQNYIITAVGHNTNLNSPTPIGLATSQLNKAGRSIQETLKAAKEAIGSALEQTGGRTIGTDKNGNPLMDTVLSKYTKKIEDIFGHEISVPKANTNLKIGGMLMSSGEGATPELLPMQGRAVSIKPADQKRIMDIYKQIADVAEKPTVRKASDLISNLDKMVDYTNSDQFGVSHDPLESVLKSMRGEINHVALRPTSPEVAAANDLASKYHDLDNGIGALGGKDLQRGELLLRRVFSGDKSRESVQLLNDIKEATGVDLVKHAALAKFATENFGDASQKTLLQQHLGQDIQESGNLLNAGVRALTTPFKLATRKLIVPDTEKYAMNLAAGKKYADTFDQLMNSPEGVSLIRTYLTNVSAAHPAAGKAILKAGRNLINNTTGIGI